MDDTIHDINASKSGHNTYTLRCPAIERQMQYASCLCRIGALDAPDVRTPADWNDCETAKKNSACTARVMRQEELLKGQSVYFVPRKPLASTEPSRGWTMPAAKPKEKAAPAQPVLTKSAGSPLIPDAGNDYAAALSLAAKELAKEPVAVATPVTSQPKPVINALVGESPLQMARRIAAARAAQSTPK